MSGETSSYDQEVELKKTPNIKVDINDLLSRVRDEKKKERKENLLFLGLIGSVIVITCLLYTSPSPRDLSTSRMPSSA